MEREKVWEPNENLAQRILSNVKNKHNRTSADTYACWRWYILRMRTHTQVKHRLRTWRTPKGIEDHAEDLPPTTKHELHYCCWLYFLSLNIKGESKSEERDQRQRVEPVASQRSHAAKCHAKKQATNITCILNESRHRQSHLNSLDARGKLDWKNITSILI